MTSHVIRSLGIGANLAIRRSALAIIGRFDEALGAGTPAGASEDTDFGYRALRRGCVVHATNELAVTHHGLRRGGETAVLRTRYLAGMAAMCMKHVRCGDLMMLLPPAREFWSFLWAGTRNLLHGNRPSGYRAALALAQGVLLSLRYRIDRQHRLYAVRG